MSNDRNEPPAHAFEDVPLPDDEWVAASGPPEDIPLPDEEWAPPPEVDVPYGDYPFDDATSGKPGPAARPGPKTSPSTGGKPAGGAREFGRGVEAKIVSGKEGVGVVGEIFWWGDSKYGEGMRAGIKGPGDKTYWVDEADLGWPDDDIPDAILEAAKAQPDMGKGDRVRVLNGKETGSEGVIFWWGESKWGDGMRAGLKTDDDETIWADAGDLEVVDAPDAPEAPDDDIPF